MRYDKIEPGMTSKGMMKCRRVITRTDGATTEDITYYGTPDSLRDDTSLRDALSGRLAAVIASGGSGQDAPGGNAATTQDTYWRYVQSIEVFGPGGLYKTALRQGKEVVEIFDQSNQ